MPRLSSFYGITIAMFWREHNHPVAHFHAEYGEHRASIAIDGKVLAGSLPPRALRLVRTWAELHEVELVANWARVQRLEPLVAIDPLP